MKKVSILVCSLALLAVSFTSCKKDPVVIIEDGFYVAGAATGSTTLNVDYRMTGGTNEVDKLPRAGMYEKYVALEANKEFYLLLKEGTVETQYGATLSDKILMGESDQPGSSSVPYILQKGSLVIGASAPALKVPTSGLYHIVLDLNLNKDLDLTGGAQVIIAPVHWGSRGINGDWGWSEFTESAFNNSTMTWTKTFATTNSGSFKFAYGGGWKIQLDDAGKVKAETNLGVGLASGAKDISIDKGDAVTVTLTWTLASGAISKSYAMTQNATKWYYDDISKAGYSLIGSAFNKADGVTQANWDYDVDLTYNATKSSITDATKFYGTYVFEKTGVVLLANGEFKIRRDHLWDTAYGYDATNIIGVGASTNFANAGGNIKVVTAGTYDVTFTFVTPAKTWTLTLTKK